MPAFGLDSRFKLHSVGKVLWCFAQANIETTAKALQEKTKARRWMRDISGSCIKVAGNFFVPFQLHGNQWTNFVSVFSEDSHAASPRFMREMSKQLKTRTLFVAYEDTSSVLLYYLFENGKTLEVLRSDGSDKPQVLKSLSESESYELFTFPSGFCFYSSARKLKRFELNARNTVQFLDQCLKTQGISLVFDPTSCCNHELRLESEGGRALGLERADFVGLLDETEVRVRLRDEELQRRCSAAIRLCNEAYFYAFKARVEYKDWASKRPTLAQCREHEADFRRLLGKLRTMLRRMGHPESWWLKQTSITGNLDLIDLFLKSRIYEGQRELVREALNAAIESNESSVALRLEANLKGVS